MKFTGLTIAFGLLAGNAVAFGQQIPSLTVGGETIQFHAFASQGFAGSDNNNFLTMKTSAGSFDMSDFGISVSSQLNDKLRVGAQMYDYNVGHLGEWHPKLDWGYVDYRFQDWLGVRAGKVKTPLGLYNATQDAAFLYTWALMPQSLYPLDLRDASIAHEGVDLYGHVPLKRAGSIDYVGYYGYVPFDPYGGTAYSVISAGGVLQNLAHQNGGEDVRWNTPISGLVIGNSVSLGNNSGYGRTNVGGLLDTFHSRGMKALPTYADYTRGKWHLSGEFRFTHDRVVSHILNEMFITDLSNKSMFVAATYRFGKRLEIGAYNSRLYIDHSSTPTNPNATHIFDQALTTRFDLTNFWNLKIEGHFMNGYGDVYSSHGFYSINNPAGLKPDTNMIVVRSGFNF